MNTRKSVDKKLKAIVSLFQKKEVLLLPDLLAALQTKSRRTAIRYLKKLNYLSSYNQGGKYYTLHEIAEFNEFGIWRHDSIGFSEHGTLKDTIVFLVDHSKRGLTSREIQSITHCGVKDALLQLVGENKICRTKRKPEVYLYLSVDHAKIQLKQRDQKSVDLPVKESSVLNFNLSSHQSMSELIECDSINDELIGIDLGDERLNKRSKKIIGKMFHGLGARLPSVFKGKLELDAAYRFYGNELVTPNKILQAHINATIKRISTFPTVLLIQDTTDVDMKHMSDVKGLGFLNDTKRPGCSCHPLIAFTPERICLGVVSNEFIIRPANTLGKQKHNNQRNIEDKESYRWIKHYKTACEIADKNPNTKIIVVADREADIYELFLETKGKLAQLVVRMWHDRKVDHKSGVKKEQLMLLEELAKTPINGNIEFEVAPARGREKRKIQQNIRSREFEFLPSEHKLKLPNIKINVIYLEEINPPKDEEPCNWILGTTLPISTKEEVQYVIDTYLSRWGIETFFKVLKSGCLIEKVQFQAGISVLNCLAMYMIIAWRLLYITYLGRTCPEFPCSIIFEKDEWQSVYAIVKNSKPPEKPVLLGAFIEMVATLGGYIKRKNSHPGPRVMWIGFQMMRGCSYGWGAAKKFLCG